MTNEFKVGDVVRFRDPRYRTLRYTVSALAAEIVDMAQRDGQTVRVWACEVERAPADEWPDESTVPEPPTPMADLVAGDIVTGGDK